MLQAWEEVLGKQAIQTLKAIPMPANTVKRRNEDMAEDIENQDIKMVKNSPFYSIQLDESRDGTNKVLLCFVRVECAGELKNYFVDSACRVERLALRFLKHLIVIPWNAGLDGNNVLGYVQTVPQTCLDTFPKLLQRWKMWVTQTFCLHTALYILSNLRRKEMSPELHEVGFHTKRSILEYLRHFAKNWVPSILTFFMLRSQPDLFTLRKEVKIFFQRQNNPKLQELFFDDEWVAKLAYLADILLVLNELNISLQGQLKDVFTLR
ncbi:LOW QUALITY PROTEIN: hypothetical protein QTO34_004165, partial [Cnephaeus nilssonii]